MHLVTGLEVNLTNTAGGAGQTVIIQLIGAAIAYQGQTLCIDGDDASVLEGTTEIDLLAIVFKNVYIHLRLFDIASQAGGDNLAQFFQGLAGHMHIADKGVEQGTVIAHYTSVGAGG